MIAQTLKALLMTFAFLVFSGCAKTIYVPQNVMVATPVACTVEEPACDNTKKTDTEIVTEARLCIRRLKDALKACKIIEIQ